MDPSHVILETLDGNLHFLDFANVDPEFILGVFCLKIGRCSGLWLVESLLEMFSLSFVLLILGGMGK